METIKTDPGAKVCDGFMNCKSGDDEINCYCPTDRFRCNCRDSVCPTGWWCITGSYRCDNWTDCTDGSDEFNCTGKSYFLKRSLLLTIKTLHPSFENTAALFFYDNKFLANSKTTAVTLICLQLIAISEQSCKYHWLSGIYTETE